MNSLLTRRGEDTQRQKEDGHVKMEADVEVNSYKVMEESSDKTWSTGEGNGKPLQYYCL